MAGPYKNKQQIDDMVAANDEAGLRKLANDYMDYFRKNQCELLSKRAWNDLGAYFLGLSAAGAHNKAQTRAEFETATHGMLRQPVPDWIQKIVYVQTDLAERTYYLALPPKELAEQAMLHAKNPKADVADYVKPPIYTGIDLTVDPETVLNVRICDYVISHCG